MGSVVVAKQKGIVSILKVISIVQVPDLLALCDDGLVQLQEMAIHKSNAYAQVCSFD